MFLAYDLKLADMASDPALLYFSDHTPSEALNRFAEMLNLAVNGKSEPQAMWFTPSTENFILTAESLRDFKERTKGSIEDWCYASPNSMLMNSSRADELSDLDCYVEKLVFKELFLRREETAKAFCAITGPEWVVQKPDVYARLGLDQPGVMRSEKVRLRRLLSVLFESPADDVFILPQSLTQFPGNPLHVTQVAQCSPQDDSNMLETLRVLAQEMPLGAAVSASRALEDN